jgi:hypothetical protein
MFLVMRTRGGVMDLIADRHVAGPRATRRCREQCWG